MGMMLFAPAPTFIYANNVIRPYSSTDKPQGQTQQTVSVLPLLYPFPCTPARLTTGKIPFSIRFSAPFGTARSGSLSSNFKQDELSQIVSVLCHCTDPEEIILFGSLAEAVSFSEITAYDLFVLTANRSPDDWNDIRSYLKFKLPSRTRTISFINLYICSPADVSGDLMLFYRFIQANGKAVYSRKTFKLKSCDYERLYFDALDRYELFFSQADGLFKTAEQSALALDWRQTAFQTACGTEMLLQALYAAYHAADCDLHSLTTLFLRMQTLSPDLFILLDPERGCSSRMLSRLDILRDKAMYKLGCVADKTEIEEYLDRAQKMKGLIEKLCTARLELYKSRIVPTA